MIVSKYTRHANFRESSKEDQNHVIKGKTCSLSLNIIKRIQQKLLRFNSISCFLSMRFCEMAHDFAK